PRLAIQPVIKTNVTTGTTMAAMTLPSVLSHLLGLQRPVGTLSGAYIPMEERLSQVVTGFLRTRPDLASTNAHADIVPVWLVRQAFAPSGRFCPGRCFLGDSPNSHL